MKEPSRIAVVGAGIVGCSCALWLQRKGFKVTLIDPEDPGSGTSFGNACTIADYGCIPINSPSLFKRLPTLLTSKDSPLELSFAYALSHPAWMLRFLANCRSGKVTHIIDQLGQLLAKTYDGLDPLLDMTEARDLMRQQGCMYAYESDSEFEQAKPSNELRRIQGASFRELDRADLTELEPNLKFPFQRGLLFEAASHVIDPYRLVQRYFECFQRNDGEFIRQRAVCIERDADAIRLRLDNGGNLQPDRIVIAAGAFSQTIRDLPLKLPLDTERGYHVQYRDHQHLLQRPVCWNNAGFYATPTIEGMRLAGTVEIAGYSQTPNPRRLAYLARKGQEMLELPDKPDQEWLGFRPTMPDSLPVIGYADATDKIIMAFGHHHIGLTLAGITGKLVAELANGEDPSHNLQSFSPQRFL